MYGVAGLDFLFYIFLAVMIPMHYILAHTCRLDALRGEYEMQTCFDASHLTILLTLERHAESIKRSLFVVSALVDKNGHGLYFLLFYSWLLQK